MPQTAELILPVVHLNGTSKERLMDAREDVYAALDSLYALLGEIAPNGRDYYPVPGLMDKAQEQHARRSKVIADLQAEIAEEIAQIDAGGYRAP